MFRISGDDGYLETGISIEPLRLRRIVSRELELMMPTELKSQILYRFRRG